MIGIDKDHKNVFTTTYTLDTTKTPWKIEMKTIKITKSDATEVPQDMQAKGLIKKDGGTLTIIYALPGGEDPTEFKTKEKQQMFVLKASKQQPVLNKFLPGTEPPPKP